MVVAFHRRPRLYCLWRYSELPDMASHGRNEQNRLQSALLLARDSVADGPASGQAFSKSKVLGTEPNIG